jgi:hypothetical protein
MGRLLLSTFLGATSILRDCKAEKAQPVRAWLLHDAANVHRVGTEGIADMVFCMTGSHGVDDGREMVVPVREDEAFDPSGAGG